MTIYEGMPNDERNEILRERYRVLGIAPEVDFNGRLLYVPDLEDKMLYYDNCQNPELKMAIGNALTSMMGDPDGNDSWTEIF